MFEGTVEVGGIIEGVVEGAAEGDSIVESYGTVIGDSIIGAFPSSLVFLMVSK